MKNRFVKIGSLFCGITFLLCLRYESVSTYVLPIGAIIGAIVFYVAYRERLTINNEQ